MDTRAIETEYTLRRLAIAEQLTKRQQEVFRLPGFDALEKQRIAALSAAARSAFAGENMDDVLALTLSKIEEEQHRLLLSHGLPADYLDEASLCRCKDCKDSGYILREDGLRTHCPCLRQRIIDVKLGEMGLSAAREQHFGAFDPNVFPDTGESPTQRQRMLRLRDYALTFSEEFPHTKKHVLLFSGPAGLGKTFLMNCIARHVTERGFVAVRVPSYRLVEDALKDREIGRLSIEADLLALDDLGAEPLYNNITMETLYTIINERLLLKKHTLISTNLTPHELSTRYTERVASRILSAGEAAVIGFSGQDIRLKRS